MLLSIGIMVKNEEKYLDKCLSSLMPILNNIDSELIIVDTGSTDNTIEIAKKYTDKIYFHKWNNDFSEIRNVTINYCKGEWFFYIDGDEIVDDCNEIINFFKSDEYKSYKSATIYIKNLVDLNDKTKYSIFSALRLFKKEKSFKFVNAVHNQPLYNMPIKCIPAFCTHYGYISTDKELMEKKYKRTVSILKNELEKNPENIYYLYQLSVSYGMHENHVKAANSIQKAYDTIVKKKENIEKYFYVLPQLCICYYNIEDYLNVEKYAIESLKYDKKCMDIYYYLGVASMVLKKYKESISSFKSYLNLNKSYYMRDKDIGSVDYTLNRVNDVYYMMYRINRQIGEYDEAKKYLLSINDSKYNVPIYVVDLLISAKKYSQIKEYEEGLVSKNKTEDIRKLYNAVENSELTMEHDKAFKITALFSLGDSPYYKLNYIRMMFENKKNVDINEINSLLEEIDLSNVPFYYGDLIYYIIYTKNDISKILKNVSNERIIYYFEYLVKKYENLSDCIYNYVLKFIENDDFQSVRINKELCRYLIVLEKIEKDKLNIVYEDYIKLGIGHFKCIYSNFVIENECWQAIREEERFFMYMSKAKQYKNENKEEYIRYLNLALHAYPIMKDLITYLLSKEKEKISGENKEFESYKAQVKSTIKSLIENEKFDSAKAVIDEYEKIVPNDMEIVLFKSQISLAEQKNKRQYKM